ncbi:nitrite reductase [Vibrio vulnificus]|uniref:nitrite reductase n=1 Tax=Vibrio vulnificus TaxID=672 RepID=UPI001594D0FD|nr:nitrite reductase [Vibrio vulnificus]EJE8556623.1 nitrite reductase [Vibrio vulnificus]ELR8704255.1 nitrite reductase [Vibrio vulnificus]ELR8772465.1 nitrite reductase [Vibrio vulnificus]NVD21927.1 nitrite reductase [Vibrio vulnificus]
MEQLGDILIVLIIFTAIFGSGMLKIFLNYREKVKALELTKTEGASADVQREMQQQIDKLTKRVIVLEKIVTDQKYQLEKEIASL